MSSRPAPKVHNNAVRAWAEVRVPVAGISFVPILRRDGSIASSPGYDAITGLFFDPRGATFPRWRSIRRRTMRKVRSTR